MDIDCPTKGGGKCHALLLCADLIFSPLSSKQEGWSSVPGSVLPTCNDSLVFSFHWYSSEPGDVGEHVLLWLLAPVVLIMGILYCTWP